ncbi:FimD/PapC N-terminal domain-containing protein [Luteimonas sp. SX5]|uniref:FimD/PapC N-terminal domain-containing protein n=1 Tax=Luteimonas galliterrae TaxID=2940486 RepID=A0ABT0MMG1_9GAMM|nr:FimD/PapC N-terminal domain-containing protein [Luteimonas galliterrae]MCL1636078.1 FimD/PapC N-terminal domain-containing protein [Luteimonas galliterrae]
MNRKTLSYALIVALAGSVALVGCKKKEEPVAATPPPAATEPAPMPEAAPPAPAATVSAVTVGTTAAADKSVAAVTTFKPTDKIIASVKTDGAASNVEVGAKLTFQDGQVAGEQKQTINTSGPETTNIEFSNANPWPAGKYTVDVTLNGAPAGTQQAIEVK